MQSLFDQGPPPPCPAPFNMAEYVLQAGTETPDKIALAVVTPTGAERWSYARLTAAIRGTATGLLDQGLHPGDRVLMRLGNTVDFPITFLAALSVDLIPVPTSSLLTTPEVSRITAEVAPELIVAEAGVSLPDPLPCPILSTGDLDEDAQPARGGLRSGRSRKARIYHLYVRHLGRAPRRQSMPTARSGRGG